ncbi:heterokaryon incompatibility protein-domain-containing protein, partial [Alternaria rosae]|uniref:heterokaryon incompatibility protein-domain-containing protein n=1 Tax=Alternaria rosae TaxID=1187941 RepID=UPI001E8E9E33
EVDEKPAYEALSYCWGDLNDQRQILCNGTTHLVTASLYDALVRLRMTNEVRIVWADALCIAQSDDEEKSSQVRRMDLIYLRAKRVVVWLGHVEDEHASNIRRLFESLELVDGNPEDYDSNWRVAGAAFGASLPWHSLQVFFSNPWFRRMWCIQEFRLAANLVYYWGTEELSKYTAVRLASWEMSHKRDLRSALVTVTITYAWRMNGPLTSDKCRLLQALSTYRRWHATDPRDKVYGILGLTELGEQRSIIPIDYEKSAAEVFHDAATAIIRWTSDLAVFAHVHHDVDYDGHPEYESWIRGGLSPTSSAYGVYKFSAPHEITTKPCGRQLVVCGSVSGIVSCTTVLLGERISDLSYVGLADSAKVQLDYPANVFLDYWRQNVSQEAPVGSDLNPAMISMARTLTAGEVSYAFSYNEASEENVTEYLQSFLNYIRLLYALSEHVTESGSIEYEFSRSEMGWKVFACLVSRCFHKWALFRAKDGSYGLGPVCLREGDPIVVLEGAYTPVALRPRGENYLLLGQVYKDEIMNGELIEEMEKGIRKRQQFCFV